ncbi:hypothetical protein [Foetidibacter luteolus]|uniref:hypothetical protein n=1 Tax=Foetidibacter luteolus TaxID=2608880 RepID=UPI00129BAED5|nr:hypothetical protein [Foetidibacter luteolus]
MNILMLYPEIRSFKKERQEQQHYFHQNILPEIEQLEKSWGTSLDHYLKHKVFNYYALYVPVVIGNSFARLHGRQLSAHEKRLLTLLGVITPFFDDFFDVEQLSEERIKQLMSDPFNAVPDTLMQHAFLHFGREIISTVPDVAFFQEISTQVFAAQAGSQLQESPGISLHTNQVLARQKGGSSLLFYYSAIKAPINRQIQELVYNTGALLQLSNDIFDAHKDKEKNIYTLVHNYSDLRDLKTYYKQQYDALLQQAQHCSLCLPRQQVKRYMRRPQMLFAMTFVALNKLIYQQNKEQLQNDWRLAQRNELVCDADRWRVQVKWLKQLMYI